MDRHAFGGCNALKGAFAIQHNHQRVAAHRPARITQAAAGGDLHRCADVIERHAMRRRQRLN